MFTFSNRQLNCSLEDPLTNVVLLKTHRTGSTSIANIFHRYGDFNNLSFVLPSAATFHYFWPLRFHHSHTRLDLLNKQKANMAINIGRYSKRNIVPMMPNDTVVLVILRDPVRHFESVFEYAEISRLMGLLNASQNALSTFLAAPRETVIGFVKSSKSFAVELNLLKNGEKVVTELFSVAIRSSTAPKVEQWYFMYKQRNMRRRVCCNS